MMNKKDDQVSPKHEFLYLSSQWLEHVFRPLSLFFCILQSDVTIVYIQYPVIIKQKHNFINIYYISEEKRLIS